MRFTIKFNPAGAPLSARVSYNADFLMGSYDFSLWDVRTDKKLLEIAGVVKDEGKLIELPINTAEQVGNFIELFSKLVPLDKVDGKKKYKITVRLYQGNIEIGSVCDKDVFVGNSMSIRSFIFLEGESETPPLAGT